MCRLICCVFMIMVTSLLKPCFIVMKQEEQIAKSDERKEKLTKEAK